MNIHAVRRIDRNFVGETEAATRQGKEFTMKRYSLIILLYITFLFFLQISAAYSQDWKTLSENIKLDFKDKIISIEQLNSSTGWAVLSSDLSNLECVKIAENIGYYIRNSTGGPRSGKTPSIHVSKGGKHIAVARRYGMKYVGKLNLEDWDPSVYNGKYRP